MDKAGQSAQYNRPFPFVRVGYIIKDINDLEAEHMITGCRHYANDVATKLSHTILMMPGQVREAHCVSCATITQVMTVPFSILQPPLGVLPI